LTPPAKEILPPTTTLVGDIERGTDPDENKMMGVFAVAELAESFEFVQ
jgi:hypothetical protein